MGALFGAAFALPVVGVAVGATAGAALGRWAFTLSSVGIEDEFVDELRQQVVPGTSALLLLSSDADAKSVNNALEGVERNLITSDLTADQEAKLQETFGRS